LLELLKFVVQPVVIERDSDGSIIREQIGEPTACYTDEQLHQFIEAVRREIRTANSVNSPVKTKSGKV
jgi:hypothetical protein